MYRISYLLFLFFILTGRLKSQILPSEGSKLNYRLIGFSFPETGSQVNNYTIEIAAGDYYSEDSFKKNVIKKLPVKQNKIIAEVPSFGRQYTWRAVTANNPESRKSEFHHFSTSMVPEVDTNIARLRIITPAEKYKDGYVFLDGNKALYDMNGHPVWYLPDIEGPIDYRKLRDLKISPFGTITFLNENRQAYEINYNGDILWKGPNTGKISRDNTESYHHEFTRLSNGHYMVLGSKDSIVTTKSAEDSNSKRMEITTFGTVIEYDEKGKVIWSWRVADYLFSGDVIYRRIPGSKNIFDTHQNAFYFDEKNKAVYVCFRDISRIAKIKYPEGTVISTYGEIFKPGHWEVGNPFFCHQHSPRISQKGYLYMYNNGCDMGTPPRVEIFQENPAENGGLKKTWEYYCDIDGMNDPRPKVFWLGTGGNVVELPDNSMFVCMGSQFSKVFIVNMDKKILWSAASEKWNAGNNKWECIPQYRASMITTRKEMEQLIWNAEMKKGN